MAPTGTAEHFSQLRELSSDFNWGGGGGGGGAETPKNRIRNGKQRVITCHSDLPYLLLVYFQMTQRKDLS